MHYTRWQTHGNPNKVIRQVAETCSIEDCGKRQQAHNLCPSHLYHQTQYGDPLAVGPGRRSGRKRMVAPSYDGAHKRIHRSKGKASAQACVDCGNPAQEWSYNGGCPNELYETLIKVPVAYSTDESRYSPRCIPCHRRRDDSSVRERGADGSFIAAKVWGPAGATITITEMRNQ